VAEPRRQTGLDLGRITLTHFNPAVGTIISFRVGAEDAPYLVQEFQEQFSYIDLVQLPNYRMYLKLMIDGMPSKPFSARGSNPSDF
jgi:hypothetical protein